MFWRAQINWFRPVGAVPLKQQCVVFMFVLAGNLNPYQRFWHQMKAAVYDDKLGNNELSTLK
jgi:hypothetical protein